VPRRRQTGISLVQLMVALLIGMLVSLSAAGSGAFYYAMQRQQAAGAGAMAQALSVRDALEHDLAQAGRGFFAAGTPLCARLNAATPGGVLTNAAAFLPARIQRVDGRDSVEVLYGESLLAGAAVHTRVGYTSDAPIVQTQSWLPVQAGNVVVLANAPANEPCLLRTVSASEADSVQGTRVTLADDGLVTAGLTVQSYPAGSRIANAGALVWRQFERNDADEVLMRDAVTGDSVRLASRVVALRAQYGVALNPGEGVAQWVDATGAWANPDTTMANRIRAVRIGIVVRSQQPERPGPSGQCEATEGAPQLWPGETVSFGNTDWRCFRYRTAVSVVALRNFVTGTTL
jgi:type IV pilus assembly protein PilW